MENNQENLERNVESNIQPVQQLTNKQPANNISPSQPTIGDETSNNNISQPLQKNKNTKQIIIIVAIAAVLIVGVIIGILFLSKDQEKPKKENDNSELAQKILTDLNMDGFIVSILTWETETNKNLLALSNSIGIEHYLAGNKDVEKYVIVFPNPSNADMIYVKYDDYVKTTKEGFGTLPTYDYKGTTMNFPNLVKNAEGKYETTLDEIGVCHTTENTDNCYALVSAGYIVDNKKAEFSKLKMKDNIITGNTKKYFDDNKMFYVDADFELKVEKKGNNYIIKSFKIKKINAQ